MALDDAVTEFQRHLDWLFERNARGQTVSDKFDYVKLIERWNAEVAKADAALVAKFDPRVQALFREFGRALRQTGTDGDTTGASDPYTMEVFGQMRKCMDEVHAELQRSEKKGHG